MTDPLDRSTLRQKAEKAKVGWPTPRRWNAFVRLNPAQYYQPVLLEEYTNRSAAEPDAELIEACSPDAVLTLLDHEAALREMVERMVKWIDYWDGDSLEPAAENSTDILRAARALLAAAETGGT